MSLQKQAGAGASGGFTLIEVLIALVVLAFGLLGFAMLQTMSVRFVESANYRSQATNLGYEIMDQVRSNRISASSYAGTYTATSDCAGVMNAAGLTGISTPAKFRSAWQCRAGAALGDGATATVTVTGSQLTVAVNWGDNRWNASGDTNFSATTQL